MWEMQRRNRNEGDMTKYYGERRQATQTVNKLQSLQEIPPRREKLNCTAIPLAVKG